MVNYALMSRCEAGSDSWVQCNDAPVKICKYPVHGLSVGHVYHFRVRAVNSAGISRPSRKSDKVTALDPAESDRLQGTSRHAFFSDDHPFFDVKYFHVYAYYIYTQYGKQWMEM